jgi:hypothetical protein
LSTTGNRIQVRRNRVRRASQGDILRDIECIERVVERSGIIEVSKIIFPLIAVLTQDCDLEQNARYVGPQKPSSDDKRLFSVLVAPLYNAEHVFAGTHLADLGLQMTLINKKRTPGETLMKNETPRYHYLDFPEDVPLVPQIVDFKHYFSLSTAYIEQERARQFVCRISALYREDLSQRFAAYLSRIGLPELKAKTPQQTEVAPA